MLKKVVVLLACLALVSLAGAALAQTKAEHPKTAPPQAQPQKPPATPAPQAQPAAPAQPAQAPVAGVQPVVLGVMVDEMVVVTKGWSVKKQILGKAVYNDKNQKIGKIYDLIVAPDKAVSYAIIASGGFLGIDKHDVAIPVNQFKLDKGKIILAGATKEALKALPSFQYAK